MKISEKNFLFTVKILIWLIFAIIIVFLVWQKAAPAGQVTYFWDFSEKPRFISDFYPVGRVALTDGMQIINSEPVYIDVYSPRRFSKAKVKIVYRSPALETKFGIKLNVNDWGFYFEKLPATGEQFQEADLEFSLAKAQLIGNKIKFSLAGPEIDSSVEKIILDSIEINLIK